MQACTHTRTDADAPTNPHTHHYQAKTDPRYVHLGRSFPGEAEEVAVFEPASLQPHRSPGTDASVFTDLSGCGAAEHTPHTSVKPVNKFVYHPDQHTTTDLQLLRLQLASTDILTLW